MMKTFDIWMSTFADLLRRHPYSSLAAATGLSALIIAFRDYRAYVAMGPHGLPDTFWGWRRQLQMSKFARKDVTASAPYDIDKAAKLLGPSATTSFLDKPLRIRSGSRPQIPGFVAPQRQTTDVASDNMKIRMTGYLKTLVAANETILQSDLSRLEGPVPAVQLLDTIERPSFLSRTRGEIIHVHPPDGSTHLVLSLADSKEVIEKSWGQRHRLSGGLLPWTYTLVYAPRNDAEFEVWKTIIHAAQGFCCNDL